MKRFRPPLGFTVFTVFGVGLLWSLCAWQLGRRAEARVELALYSERLQLPAFDASHPPEAPELRRVQASGTPDWDHVQRIIGRYMWTQPGMQLLVPLAVEGGHVLVDVGWVPEDDADAIIARERAAGAVRTYSGIARPFTDDPDARLDGGKGGEWRAVSPPAIGRELGKAFPSWVVIDGEGLAEDASIPDRVPPISGWRMVPVQRPHGEYAFTWFGLGMSLLLVWLSLSFSRTADHRSFDALPQNR